MTKEEIKNILEDSKKKSEESRVRFDKAVTNIKKVLL